MCWSGVPSTTPFGDIRLLSLIYDVIVFGSLKSSKLIIKVGVSVYFTKVIVFHYFKELVFVGIILIYF